MKYSGKLGFAEQTETSPGVWEETITEKDIVGDLEQRTEPFDSGEGIHPRVSTTTSVSVLAYGIGPQDHSEMRYATYAGKRWQFSSIVDEPPKLTLYFGEEYHGPIPS
jgi:hypothetical protein